MSTIYVDFAVCPCGEQTAIRPAKTALATENRQSSETDNDSIAVACPKCRRVYTFHTGEMVPIPTPWGVGPYNPEAPMTVFRVPIECDVLNCKAQLLVHTLLKSHTTDAQVEEATMHWNTSELLCPAGGHSFQWPPFRH
jgi:hypothetical protein